MDLKVRDGQVAECNLKISENKRFFTQAVVGLKYSNVPMTMSRICGTCSAAHVICSTEAIEKAFGTKVTEQTMRLRNLLANASHLRDHAMHLYFFVLPDVFGIDSVLDFGDDLHKWIHYGLDVKEAGNYLSTIIGGRAIHPPNAIVGGFTKFPTKEEVAEAKKKLKDVRIKIIAIIDLLYNKRKDFLFKRKTNYVGLVNNDYNFLEGKLKTARGTEIPEEKFADHLDRVVLPYSHATAFAFESKEYLVGALARMNINKDHLNPHTQKYIEKYLKVFPSTNVFDSNLAQAIEMLNITDNSINILNTEIKPEKPITIIPKKSTGVGVIEAPRGTLYYRLDLDEKGIVTFADLCIPTQQNILHMEKSISAYVESLIKKDKTKEEISFEVEKMIRAYDPCMSCAAHFLKIDWI
ncbi:MAG: nickel-dependent hydrogenase large subunit [Nanoarchaeota archaeon]|nr:nickel-dependent hydrogenase large subunit [Nanoarchaeota archaeon]